MSTTTIEPLPFRANLEQYQEQAEGLFEACKSGDSETIRGIEESLVTPPASSVCSDTTALADAQLLVARRYSFEDWSKLAEYVEAVATEGSTVSQFESAVEAIIAGDAAALQLVLRENPELIRARSMREHRSTLLIYVGANGVEGYRQRTPANAVEIAKILLDAGAEIDAVGTMYRGTTTLGLVATSVHPFIAGVQNALIDILLEHGASFDHAVAPDYTKGFVVTACLANGRPEAAEYLAERGAPLDLEGAAGVGRLDVVKGFFNEDGSLKDAETEKQMEKAFILACGCGRTDVAEFLLERGVDIGASDGETGLHMAAHGGHLETVKFLLERKAPLEVKNMYGGTVLGQALWSAYNHPRADHLAIIETLIDSGAEVGPGLKKWVEELRRRQAAKGESH